MRHRYHTLDVFTDRVFGGNPLAVFPDARGIPPARMQRAARELNLSETVFVLPPETAEGTRRLRIFTPGVELPFAGHPTVGTAILLALLGEVPLEDGEARVVFEEGAGPVPVTIRGRGGKADFAQLSAAMLPERRPSPVARGELAALLGLSAEDVAEDAEAVSCGVPFLIVPVRTIDALGRIRVDHATWDRRLAREWAPHVYAWTPAEGGAGFRVRMFAPAMGIAEDPATGAAASSFAGYLALREAAEDGAFRWTVEQGIEMGRPSTLRLEADKAGGRVTAIRVGGSAVAVGEGWMEIPEE